ncbi:unnamed protein product [Spirodela intermedia]|uniref:Uncharacterized protein n=1 Tax=Spirodela intermedia TaxID=51605 RepID=A0A7I8IEK4_SPIIN|nr:unnamed protein product [Spirodela intermedia]CAA6655533.1 unnamed protein product [Spirodela intermedia]
MKKNTNQHQREVEYAAHYSNSALVILDCQVVDKIRRNHAHCNTFYHI